MDSLFTEENERSKTKWWKQTDSRIFISEERSGKLCKLLYSEISALSKADVTTSRVFIC